MILKTSIYFDDLDVNTKEALYAATAAARHKPEEKGAYSFDVTLPNGKEMSVDCNESRTQIRVARIPV